MERTLRARFWVMAAMVAGVAAMRVLPHPPNFTPVAAMALFGGAHFHRKAWAFAVPLTAMLMSDAAFHLLFGWGFHALMPLVYQTFAVIVCLGFLLRRRRGIIPVATAAIAGSVLFFLTTNLGVWAEGGLYPQHRGRSCRVLHGGAALLRRHRRRESFLLSASVRRFRPRRATLPYLRPAENHIGHGVEGFPSVQGRPKALVSWSTGKDSAFALHEVQRTGEVEVVGLLTTLTSSFGRVSMHGVRESLLDRQMEELGLPCAKVSIPSPCPNEVYEREIASVLSQERERGVTHIVFGDLFLEDLRSYREARLGEVSMQGIFPLWLRDTAELAHEMLAAGLRATITCVDPRKLPPSFAGRTFDAAFLQDLPPNVDPCGENGEFHTCVTAGPMFRRPILVRPGEVVERDGFVFADLLPE